MARGPLFQCALDVVTQPFNYTDTAELDAAQLLMDVCLWQKRTSFTETDGIMPIFRHMRNTFMSDIAITLAKVNCCGRCNTTVKVWDPTKALKIRGTIRRHVETLTLPSGHSQRAFVSCVKHHGLMWGRKGSVYCTRTPAELKATLTRGLTAAVSTSATTCSCSVSITRCSSP